MPECQSYTSSLGIIMGLPHPPVPPTTECPKMPELHAGYCGTTSSPSTPTTECPKMPELHAGYCGTTTSPSTPRTECPRMPELHAGYCGTTSSPSTPTTKCPRCQITPAALGLSWDMYCWRHTLGCVRWLPSYSKNTYPSPPELSICPST